MILVLGTCSLTSGNKVTSNNSFTRYLFIDFSGSKATSQSFLYQQDHYQQIKNRIMDKYLLNIWQIQRISLSYHQTSVIGVKYHLVLFVTLQSSPPIIRQFPPKANPLIRADLRCTEKLKNYQPSSLKYLTLQRHLNVQPVPFIIKCNCWI